MPGSSISASEATRWVLNAGLRILPFQGDGGARWLLELDDTKGRTQRVVVTDRVKRALMRFGTPSTLVEVTDALRREGWGTEVLDSLKTLLQEDCPRRNLLVREGAGVTCAPMQSERPGYMTASLRLLSPRAVNPLARCLSPVFSRPGLVLGCCTALLGFALLLWALQLPRVYASPTSAELLLGILLGLFVLLVHELGHAAAAWRCGARRVSIGVGWYVLFPVSWAELSECWRLPARQRALIDVAGVFLQAQLVLAFMLVYLATSHALLLASAAAASASILWNLNPLLRLDGYWLLSDLLGRSDLRRDGREAMAAMWQRLRPSGAAKETRALPRGLTPGLLPLLAVYGLACTGVFAVVLVLAGIQLWRGLLQDLPARLQAFADLSLAEIRWADAIVLVGALLWKSLLLFMLARFLFGLAARALRRTRTTKRASPRVSSPLTAGAPPEAR